MHYVNVYSQDIYPPQSSKMGKRVRFSNNPCDEFSEQRFNSYCVSCSVADHSLPQIFFHIFFTQFDCVLLNWASRAAEKPPTASFTLIKWTPSITKSQTGKCIQLKLVYWKTFAFCTNHTTIVLLCLFVFNYNTYFCQT